MTDYQLDRRDLVGLAKLILIELDKINQMWNEILEQAKKDQDARVD